AERPLDALREHAELLRALEPLVSPRAPLALPPRTGAAAHGQEQGLQVELGLRGRVAREVGLPDHHALEEIAGHGTGLGGLVGLEQDLEEQEGGADARVQVRRPLDLAQALSRALLRAPEVALERGDERPLVGLGLLSGVLREPAPALVERLLHGLGG